MSPGSHVVMKSFAHIYKRLICVTLRLRGRHKLRHALFDKFWHSFPPSSCFSNVVTKSLIPPPLPGSWRHFWTTLKVNKNRFYNFVFFFRIWVFDKMILACFAFTPVWTIEWNFCWKEKGKQCPFQKKFFVTIIRKPNYTVFCTSLHSFCMVFHKKRHIQRVITNFIKFIIFLRVMTVKFHW